MKFFFQVDPDLVNPFRTSNGGSSSGRGWIDTSRISLNGSTHSLNGGGTPNGSASCPDSPPSLQVKTSATDVLLNNSSIVITRKPVQQQQLLLPPPPPLVKAVHTVTAVPRQRKKGGGGNADVLDKPFQCSNCDHLSDTRSGALLHCQQFHDINTTIDPDSCPLVPRLISGYYQVGSTALIP